MTVREAIVDLDAIRRNVEALRARVGPAAAMAVVKADAYGHGAVAVARAALDGGAAWLGTADVREALALREAGIEAPVLAWLHEPDADFADAVAAGIEIGVSSAEQLEAVAGAAGGCRAHVHLKFDTGLSRNGIPQPDRPRVLARARVLEEVGSLRVTGLFSHLSNASEADDAEQIADFERGLAEAAAAGIRPEVRHLASTAGALRRPAARYDLVRLGIGVYGLSPFGDGTSSAELGLTPAMTLRSRVAAVRRVAAGTGASYDYTWRAPRDTTLALVPLGYADGVPRHLSNSGEVSIAGRRHRIAGRVAMDQFIVDVGDTPVAIGAEVVLFGDPATGAPSADDWAETAGTINYEIVTRIGPRVRRRYLP